MDVALVTDDKEVEEMRQRPRLLLHRQPRPAQLPALVSQEPVSVRRPGRPHRPAREPEELEDRRPVPAHPCITHPGAHRRQQILIDQLLLVVLQLLSRDQTARGIQGPHHRKAHDCSRSPRPTTRLNWRRSFRNPDELSNIWPESACRSWPGQTRHPGQVEDHELRKVPVSDPAEPAALEAAGYPGPEQDPGSPGDDLPGGYPDQGSDTGEDGLL